MCKIDWHLLFEGLTALGTILVTILAIWGDRIKKILFRPELKIVIEDYYKEVGTYNAGVAWYYHLVIINKKKHNPAQDCKVLLKRVIASDGTEKKIQFDVSFIWSPSDKTNETETIFQSKAIDFVVLTNENIVIPCLTRGISFDRKELINPNEKVRFEIQAVANEISSKPQTFEVFWKEGLWPSENIEPIIIKEVK